MKRKTLKPEDLMKKLSPEAIKELKDMRKKLGLDEIRELEKKIGEHNKKYKTKPVLTIPDYGWNFSYKAYDYLPLLDKMLPLMRQRFNRNSSWTDGINIKMMQSAEYTLHFLGDNGYLKELPEDYKFKLSKLWNKNIKMNDEQRFLKQIISSALIRYCYPSMAQAMYEGKIMSHWGLTCVFEAVEYTMEYLIKYDLLKSCDHKKNKLEYCHTCRSK